LKDLDRAEAGVELSRHPKEFRRGVIEPAREEQIEVSLPPAQARSGKTAKGPKNPFPGGLALGLSERRTAGFVPQTINESRQLPFPCRALSGGKGAFELVKAAAALLPESGQAIDRLPDREDQRLGSLF
jgi:hypothetical protein